MDGAYLLGAWWREAVHAWRDLRAAVLRAGRAALRLARAGRLLGSARGRLAVRSALRARAADRRGLPRREPERVRAPGRVTGARPEPGGGTVTFERARLRLLVTAGGAVFCGWDGAEPEPSYALAGGCPAADSRAQLEPDGEGWRVVAERMTVRVSPVGAVSFHTPGGLLLRAEGPPRWWEPAAGGGRTRWEQQGRLPADARVFGLGARAGGPVLRAGRYRLWNTDPGGPLRPGGPAAHLAVPVQTVVADAGCHLVFHDNTWDGEVRLWDGREGEGSAPDRPAACRISMEGGPLRYWVLAGTPARVLAGWAALTGRAVVPPRWALGLHHARRGPGATSAESVRAAVDGYLRHGLPLSAVHLDGDHLDGRRVFTADPVSCPELPAAVAGLAGERVRLVSAVHPAVKAGRGSAVYDGGAEIGAFVRDARGREVRGAGPAGESVFPDVTDPAVRRWWGGLYQEGLERGFSGFWHVLDEPVSEAAFGDPTLPRSARHALEGRGGDHREAHNVYGLMTAAAGYEGLRRRRPLERPFLLSRAGWAGLQRYGGAWPGDVRTGWEGLRASLALVLGLGLCGVPYAGVDIGGVGGPLTPELYLRWFQLAAWLPLLRTAAATDGGAREPWEFGPEVLGHVRAALAERRRLLPYMETLARTAHRTGAPYVRPLWWKGTGDRGLRECADAFLLGDALLVAPVLEPGAVRRRVRLPRGRWYDTATGVAHAGRGTVELAAPLDRIPVLARAGAVLPVAGPDGSVALEVWAPREGRTGGGELAVGDAEGWGPVRRERFVSRWEDGRVAVAREDGSPPGHPVRVRGLREGAPRGGGRAAPGGSGLPSRVNSP
jgi:alpha-glucosidase